MKREQNRDEFIRKRQARQRKLRKRRLKIFFSFLIIFLIITAAVLTLTVFFPINNITAKGSKVYNAEDIIKYSGIAEGDNLFTVSSQKALKSLKEKLPYIDNVELERKLPDSITIKVRDADEYACIESKGKYYTVSKSGWVLAENTEPVDNILRILGAKVKCKVASELQYQDAEQSELIDRISNSLKENEIATDYIDITDNLNLNVGVEKRFTVIIGSSNNIEEKIKHLGSMLKEIDGKKQGKIDLSMWTVDNSVAYFTEKNDK